MMLDLFKQWSTRQCALQLWGCMVSNGTSWRIIIFVSEKADYIYSVRTFRDSNFTLCIRSIIPMCGMKYLLQTPFFWRISILALVVRHKKNQCSLQKYTELDLFRCLSCIMQVCDFVLVVHNRNYY